ncbi:MAG: hypothetical protein JKY67_21035, partial [Pseudomonadales bacterium]|nr:hypothetical protein [Pseudomonadales bacterium]
KIEAKNTDWFYSNSSSSKYVIPRVYPELSNDKIITTSMIEGVHLDVWLSKNPDQEMKNHYGQLLVDFYEESLYLKSTLQADPNIGNYLFREDGKLGLIDFGCTKAINKNDLDTIKKIFTSKESEEFT